MNCVILLKTRRSKKIRRIIFLFFLLLWTFVLLPACSDSVSYSVAVRRVSCETTKCRLDLDVKSPGREPPQVLLTLDRSPQTSADGVRFEGTSHTLEIQQPGEHRIFLTLVEGKRFLTSPVSTVVFIDPTVPKKPEIKWRLKAGKLLLELSGPDKSVDSFKVRLNGKSEELSSSGNFLLDIQKGEEYLIQGYSLRGAVSSEHSLLDLYLGGDEPPSLNVSTHKPYTGGLVKFSAEDDWDELDNLSITAYIDESGIKLLCGNSFLLPRIPLPQGKNTLVVRAVDSAGNETVIREELFVVKKISEKLPELYIEEGAVRNAKWISEEGTVTLQKFSGGEWVDISTHQAWERTSTIPKETLSSGGDLYRLTAIGPDELSLPSVPVFAKESFFKRFSTEFISSLLGMDALLIGGNDYQFYGNIVVRDNSVMKVESGSSLSISRGNTLLVSGVLDLEGGRERIEINPNGSTGTIEVTKNGIMLARNVNFNKTKFIAKGAGVVVMENCEFLSGIEIKGARTVQIYNCLIEGNLTLENVKSVFIHSSEFNTDTFRLSNIVSATFSESEINGPLVESINSKIDFVSSRVNSVLLSIDQLSGVTLVDSFLDLNELGVSGASSTHLESVELARKLRVSIHNLSRLSLPEELKSKLDIEQDFKSVSVTY